MWNLFQFLVIVVIINSSSSNPINNLTESIDYRLPQTIRPTKYEITLKLERNFYTTNEFVGAVTIYLKVEDETNQIKLHSQDLEITSATLTLNNENVAKFGADSLNSDPVTDILTIPLESNLSVGEYSLVIEFKGVLSEIDMHGFYKSSYFNKSGEVEYLLATQFEPTHARRAFPCFDEPEFKAIFNLFITHPDDFNALSNTPTNGDPTPLPLGLVATEFKPTPVMSTYLVAFAVSKFSCDSGKNLTGNLQYRVCSRPEMANFRQTALDYGPKLMQYLETFTGRTFQDSGIGKLDQIAIPDFSPGAMENWGLITYKESGILYDPNESSNNFKQRLLMIIAHEFTHSWFGNLVTTKWWSDTFLNEGFARLFQFYAAAEVEKLWQLDLQFVIEVLQNALVADAANDSSALSTEVSRKAEISSRFGTISYSKGASVLRMVSHIIGEDNFKRRLQQYIKAHQSGSVLAQDLWSSLNDPTVLPGNLDLSVVMNEWTYKAGYPVIKVDAHGKTVIFSQERFLYSGEDSTKWYVPITFTSSTNKSKFADTKPQYWLLPTSDLVVPEGLTDEKSWIILNNQQIGFYRVDYNDVLWGRISSALRKPLFDGIPAITRSQIVDDLFNFARAGTKTYSYIFDIIEFLQKDTNYYSWYSAFQGFKFLLGKIGDSKLRDNLAELILFSMENLYKSVPFVEEYPDSQIYTFKQALTLNWACKLGNRDCVTIAQQKFAQFKEDGIPLSRNLRGIIYCSALRYSNKPGDDWEFLWNKYENTQLSTEQVTLLSSLGCVQNIQILRKYLTKIFDENLKIRRQDTSTALSSIYNNNPDGSSIIFKYIVDNYQTVLNFYQSEESLISLIENLIDQFTTSTQIDQINSLIGLDALNVKAKEALEQAKTKANENLKLIAKYETDLNDYFTKHANSGFISKSNSLLLLTTILLTILLKL